MAFQEGFVKLKALLKCKTSWIFRIYSLQHFKLVCWQLCAASGHHRLLDCHDFGSPPSSHISFIMHSSILLKKGKTSHIHHHDKQHSYLLKRENYWHFQKRRQINKDLFIKKNSKSTVNTLAVQIYTQKLFTKCVAVPFSYLYTKWEK